MKRIAMLVLLVVLGTVAARTFAQSSDMSNKDTKGMDMKSMDMKSMDMDKKATTTTYKGIGVVKNINTADGVVTLAHEPIKSLNWPAMTMAFKVKDKMLVDQIKPGDKVEFTLVQADKGYVITSIK